ncbi:AraC family transcriptional regulator [Rapidithrix thailandica]|uniref:AraC family transcriptional regulator n=1 Tax=Rapidithrix thailandica TaxID=413964 RepID=A0AAW9SB59_9BACT
MNVVQFSVPVANEASVVIEEDILPYFYNVFHRHREVQLTFILKGGGTLLVGNYTQTFQAGDIYVIGANQPHLFKSEPEHYSMYEAGQVHAIHVFFDPEVTLKEMFALPECSGIRKFLDWTKNGIQVSREKVEEVSLDLQRLKRADSLERLLMFVQILQKLSKDVNGYRSLSNGFSKFPLPDSEGIRMNRIYQYTINHYGEDISLEKIAAVAHLTPHAFCKYFKKHTRKTYRKFLNEIRINEACKKMIRGEYEGISSVVYSSGFTNRITFNRVFKRVIGMSPTEYLRTRKRKPTDDSR